MSTHEILARLVAFPTLTDGPCTELIDWVEAFLRARGFATHRIPDPTGTKAGLLARLGPASAPGAMLSAHCDVVPVEGQAWTRDPFRLSEEGGRLYGRGTTDMKGFLACMLSAADRAAQAPLRAPLKLAISYDEEIGCRGLPAMLPHLAATIGPPDLCVVGEPTNLRMALGHKGKSAYRATCEGEPGHSAEAPSFRNALHLGADFSLALRALQADLAAHGAQDPAYAAPYTTVHLGKMSGGTALNIVPDRCVLDYEIRRLPADPLGPLEARLAAEADRIGGPHITLERTNDYPGLELSPDAPAARAMAGLLAAAGLDPAPIKVSYGTEAGHFQAAGIPALVCGPGDMAQGHKPDEFIEIAQLAACDRLLDRLLDSLR